MEQEQTEVSLPKAEFESGYWRRRLVHQGAVLVVVLIVGLLFRTMDWPRSAAAFMGVWFFLTHATAPAYPGAPPTPLWRRLAVATGFGVVGWWLLSIL